MLKMKLVQGLGRYTKVYEDLIGSGFVFFAKGVRVVER